MRDCIVNRWPEFFKNLYGGAWPLTYACVDVETTGYSFDKDVITQWGHVLVEGGRVAEQVSIILDWSNHPIVPDHWLRNRLAATRSGMAQAGRTCHHSYARMCREGVPAAKALASVRDFTAGVQRRGVPFVAHGGVFDEKMLAANLVGFGVAADFSFGDNGLIDTEAVVKASQLLDNPRCRPQQGDTLRSYFHRVKYTRVAGIMSSLDGYCHEHFLAKHGIDRATMHDAAVDAYCCHLLMEEFRSALREAPAVRTPVPTPPASTADPSAIAAAAQRPQGESLARPPAAAAPRDTAPKRYRGQRNR